MSKNRTERQAGGSEILTSIGTKINETGGMKDNSWLHNWDNDVKQKPRIRTGFPLEIRRFPRAGTKAAETAAKGCSPIPRANISFPGTIAHTASSNQENRCPTEKLMIDENIMIYIFTENYLQAAAMSTSLGLRNADCIIHQSPDSNRWLLTHINHRGNWRSPLGHQIFGKLPRFSRDRAAGKRIIREAWQRRISRGVLADSCKDEVFFTRSHISKEFTSWAH